jgi:hypothetical protein
VTARRVGLGCVALVLAACTIGRVESTPFEGPAPSAILVLPPVSLREGLAMDIRGFAYGAERAIAERGYRALPLGAGFDLAQRCGALTGDQPEPDALQRLQQQVGVDAVLRIEISAWEVEPGARFSGASWDVTWRLLSTESGVVLWQHRLQGNWRKVAEMPDHLRRDEMEPQPALIGGTRPQSFASERELVFALHRSALSRMPESVR